MSKTIQMYKFVIIQIMRVLVKVKVVVLFCLMVAFLYVFILKLIVAKLNAAQNHQSSHLGHFGQYCEH